MTPSAEARFGRLWAALGARGRPDAAWADLAARYAEPARAYHTLRHVLDCLAELDGARGLASDPVAVEAALWFHDVVYDPRARDNEARSAALARAALGPAGVADPRVAAVERLILETRHSAAPAGDGDAALVVDVDLAILGAEPARFAEYEAGVRREYGFVPDAAFREGRGTFLRGLLARQRLFATEAFRARYEAKARANLARSLAALGG